jgi:serine/threonine-protein kinase
MGRVVLATQRGPGGFQKLVVLKYLRPELAEKPDLCEAFLQEARLGAFMNHPNIAQVHEVLTDTPVPIIVMEYLEGRPLSALRSTKCEMALELFLIAEALRGLAHFHELVGPDGRQLNPVHRDVSPHNVFVTVDGVVKLLDFGIARVHALDSDRTATGIIKGKLRYMAPEQLVGEEVDARTDLFAMGILLWEAIAKRPLWDCPDGAVIQRLAYGQLPSLREAAPEAPEALLSVVDSALKVERSERVQSAHELRTRLVEAIGTLGPVPQTDDLRSFLQTQYGTELSAQRSRIAKRLLAPPDRWSTPPPLASGDQPSAAGSSAANRLGSSDATVAVGPHGRTRTWVVPALALFVVAGGLALAANHGLLGVSATDSVFSATSARASMSSPPPTAARSSTRAAAAERTASPLQPRTDPAPPRPGKGCGDPFLLDDFEDNDGAICAAQGRHGTWTVYGDGTGTSYPEFGDLARAEALPEPRGSSRFGLLLSGQNLEVWGLGAGAVLNARKAYDLSRHKGLTLWARANRKLQFRVVIATGDTLEATWGGRCRQTSEVKCDDHYGAKRTVAQHWQWVNVSFFELRQEGYGKKASFSPEDAREVHVQVKAPAQHLESFELWIDDVTLY